MGCGCALSSAAARFHSRCSNCFRVSPGCSISPGTLLTAANFRHATGYAQRMEHWPPIWMEPGYLSAYGRELAEQPHAELRAQRDGRPASPAGLSGFESGFVGLERSDDCKLAPG